MEQETIKRELKAIDWSLTNPHVVGPVIPVHIEYAVRYASGDRLRIAAIDRYGFEFGPTGREWNEFKHSFYNVKLGCGDYPVVGRISIPQPVIGSSSSIVDVLRVLCREFPLNGDVVVRHSLRHVTPFSANGETVQYLGRSSAAEMVVYHAWKRPIGTGLNGYSIRNGGERVCGPGHCGLCEEVIRPFEQVQFF